MNTFCPICGKSCKGDIGLTVHIEAKHRGDEPHLPCKCEQCGKPFASDRQVRDHVREVHGEKAFSPRHGWQTPKSKKPTKKKAKPRHIGTVAPCPRHGLMMERRNGPYGTYYACPLRPTCDIIGDWSDHDHRFHVSTQADRDARKLAHAAFDPLWQSGHMKRKEAYEWLAARLGISESERHEKCHMKHFSESEAMRVVEVVREYVSADRSLHDSLLALTGAAP